MHAHFLHGITTKYFSMEKHTGWGPFQLSLLHVSSSLSSEGASFCRRENGERKKRTPGGGGGGDSHMLLYERGRDARRKF